MRFEKQRAYMMVVATALLITIASVCPVSAQLGEAIPSNPDPANASESPTPTPTPAPSPILVSDINTRAESDRNQIELIQKGLGPNTSVQNIETSLPALRKEIDNRSAETTSLLSARPSLEILRTVENDWQITVQSIPAWKSELETSISLYDASLKQLNNLAQTWSLTLKSLMETQTDQNAGSGTGAESNTQSDTITSEAAVPRELVSTARSMIALLDSTVEKINQQRARVLGLQSLVIKQDMRANEMLKAIGDVREEALGHLFVRDSQPIWSSSRTTSSFGEMFEEAGKTYRDQFFTIGEYVSAKWDSVILHSLVVLLFAGVLFWAKIRLRPLVEDDPALKPAYSVFELPIAGALIMALMLSGRFYQQAPRMLMALLGAAILIPGVLYLRKILEKPLYPIFNALLVLYLFDLLRQITATLPLLSRIIFAAEMFGAILFMIWFLRTRGRTDDLGGNHQNVFVVVKKLLPVLIALFAIALIADIFGFVSLSYTIGNSSLSSAYFALVLFATIQILNSLVVFALRVQPLSRLGMVRNHRELIKRKILGLLKWAGIIAWILLTLNLFSIRQNVLGFLFDWLSAEIHIGSLSFSGGDVLLFGFTIWLSFALSRLIRFVLDEDIYPNVNLAGGVAYAISTILHYLLLLAGLLFAIAAIGINLTNFTILAGAFGVGIGFGMQAIVNNFVSGLILLFERPVKVDDFVQVGTHQGTLKRIGLRASVLRTLNGSEVILPNGQLISEEVTNWTFSDQERRLEIGVGVAYGTDPRVVMALLDKIGNESPDILSEPAPRSVFVGFGESSLDFQLRAWTDRADQWVVVQSDLTLAIHDALTEANIEIPFPQRDLHVRDIDSKTLAALKSKED